VTKKILIVEDEAHIRLLIEQSLEELEDLGVELLPASDGAAGLAIAREKSPDLVLLDVMMPRMNGFDVCKALRADASNAAMKIIFLTAKGQEYDRAMGEQIGSNGYMTKPFDPDELLEVARAAVGLGD